MDLWPGSIFDPSSLVNKYTYCFNNPLNFTDPLGLCGDDNPEQKDMPTGRTREVFLGKEPVNFRSDALSKIWDLLTNKYELPSFFFIKFRYNYERLTEWATFRYTWKLEGGNPVLLGKTQIPGTERWEHSYYFYREIWEPDGMPSNARFDY